MSGHLEGMMETMESTTRTYRFVVTVEVEPGHPAYDES